MKVGQRVKYVKAIVDYAEDGGVDLGECGTVEEISDEYGIGVHIDGKGKGALSLFYFKEEELEVI